MVHVERAHLSLIAGESNFSWEWRLFGLTSQSWFEAETFRDLIDDMLFQKRLQFGVQTNWSGTLT